MKATRVIVILVILLLVVAGGWQYFRSDEGRVIRFTFQKAPAESGSFSYSPYAAILARYVSRDGMVNYGDLRNQSSDLDAFAASLADIQPQEYEAWSEQQKIAFWINAYNALTLEVIVSHYPIKASVFRSVAYPENSIRQIPGVWDKLRFVVLGREMTLDEIEHATLRSKFNEPRIHVALVCAAISCPPLRSEPYAGERLDEQLDDQAHRFLKGPQGLRIDRDGGKVYLSSILKWFGEDFLKAYGVADKFAGRSDVERAVLSFVSRYVSDDERNYLLSGSYEVEYLDYDWSLNEQPAR